MKKDIIKLIEASLSSYKELQPNYTKSCIHRLIRAFTIDLDISDYDKQYVLDYMKFHYGFSF